MVTFWTALVVTLALLAGAVVTGLRHRRRAHFVLAPLAIGMLAVTVVLTEQMARAVRFPEFEMGIHLWFAKTGTALVIPVVATGLLTVRRPRWRRIHLACVALFLLVAVIATATGVWAFSLAEPE